MSDPILDRLLDRLPVNPPYTGVAARGYDAWLPVEGLLEDEAVYRRLLGGVRGTILELGCGTGRPLLRWLADGLDVEGLDNSTDMLATLRRHAQERGLSPVVHLGGMAPLELGRRFAAIVCPAGTFTLIDDPGRARAALGSYLSHLEPGGLLALTLLAPSADAPSGGRLTWRIRRTGTDDTGTTYLVDEATTEDRAAQVTVVYHRIEVVDPEGRLCSTELRRQHLRWWSPTEFESMLRAHGFVDVRSLGPETGWAVVGRAP